MTFIYIVDSLTRRTSRELVTLPDSDMREHRISEFGDVSVIILQAV